MLKPPLFLLLCLFSLELQFQAAYAAYVRHHDCFDVSTLHDPTALRFSPLSVSAALDDSDGYPISMGIWGSFINSTTTLDAWRKARSAPLEPLQMPQHLTSRVYEPDAILSVDISTLGISVLNFNLSGAQIGRLTRNYTTPGRPE